MDYAQQASPLQFSLMCNPAGPRAAHSPHLPATANTAASRAGTQLLGVRGVYQAGPATIPWWNRSRSCRQAPPGGERRVDLHRLPIADRPLLGLGHGLQLVASALGLQHYVRLTPQLVNGLQQLRLLHKCKAKSRTIQDCKLPGEECQRPCSAATLPLCSALLGVAASMWHTQALSMRQPALTAALTLCSSSCS